MAVLCIFMDSNREPGGNAGKDFGLVRYRGIKIKDFDRIGDESSGSQGTDGESE